MNSKVSKNIEYRKIRPLVLERDNYRCIKCGSETELECHHVNGYGDNSIENLQTLCVICHSSAPMGDDYWEWLAGEDNIKPKSFVERMCDARKFHRLTTEKVEGRKAFGEKLGEEETLSRIKQLAEGTLSYRKIADELNAERRATRMGGPWKGSSVQAIVKKNGWR